MELSTYLSIQLIVMGVIYALGGQMLFTHVPDELKKSHIYLSGRVMGLAMTIVPIGSFIYYFTGMQHAAPEYATAMNLSAYCLTSTLVAMAYYILLDQKIDKPMMKTHLAIGILYPFPLWIALHYGSDFIAETALISSYTLFCALVVIHIATCYYYYKKKLQSSRENDLTQLQRSEILLLKKTIIASLYLMIISMLSPSFFRYPMWLGLVFMASFVAWIIFIYINYKRIFAYNIRALIRNQDDDDDSDDLLMGGNTISLNKATKRNIEQNLTQWLTRKEYLQPEISINQVAKAAFTNRTYLSKYINSEYQCTFKAWITELRIEEARNLLKAKPELSIAEIATQTGFASAESFSHIFTRQHHITPSKWRDTN